MSKYAETIERINALTEEMSSLQKEKRRLMKRLLYEIKAPITRMNRGVD
jgi:predicted transcriptional regulator